MNTENFRTWTVVSACAIASFVVSFTGTSLFLTVF